MVLCVREEASVPAVVPLSVPQCAEAPQHSSNTEASGWAAPLTGGAAEGREGAKRSCRRQRAGAGCWRARRGGRARREGLVRCAGERCEFARQFRSDQTG